MRALSEFRPPEHNRAVIAFCQFLIPIYCRYIDHFTCRFSDEHQSLAALRDKRTIILLNHADRQDPSVVVFLAKHLKEQIHCMVAREVFDWYHGVLGWFFQKFGCYSVNRGAGDTTSIETTKRILKAGKHKLVVFPEAEITGDDHLVHTISTALVHILLEVQEELSEPLWVLPVGISYKLETALEVSLERALNAVEKQVGIKNSVPEISTRISNAIDKLISNLADHYSFVVLSDHTQAEKVSGLTKHICNRIAQFIGSEITHKTPEQLLYLLRNAVDEKLGTHLPEGDHQKKLSKRNRQFHDEFINDLNRVENLLIFHRVLQQPSSAIQLCRTVDFLEVETIGRISSKGRQVATVYFGQPLSVADYLTHYKESKHAAIAELKTAIHDRLQAALDCSQSVSSPS